MDSAYAPEAKSKRAGRPGRCGTGHVGRGGGDVATGVARSLYGGMVTAPADRWGVLGNRGRAEAAAEVLGRGLAASQAEERRLAAEVPELVGQAQRIAAQVDREGARIEEDACGLYPHPRLPLLEPSSAVVEDSFEREYVLNWGRYTRDLLSGDEQVRKRAVAVRDAVRASGGSRGLLVYDPLFSKGRGRVAVVVGKMDTAEYVTVLVPGMGSSLKTFAELAEHARDLHEACVRARPGAGVAVVAWQGYKAPCDFRKAASEEPARAGGELLRNDLARWHGQWRDSPARRSRGMSARPVVTVSALSYGSVVAGHAVASGDPAGGVGRTLVSAVAQGALNGVLSGGPAVAAASAAADEALKGKSPVEVVGGVGRRAADKAVKNKVACASGLLGDGLVVAAASAGADALLEGGSPGEAAGSAACTAVEHAVEGKVGCGAVGDAAAGALGGGSNAATGIVTAASGASAVPASGAGATVDEFLVDNLVLLGSPGSGLRAKHLDVGKIYVAATGTDAVSMLDWFSIDPAHKKYGDVVRMKADYQWSLDDGLVGNLTKAHTSYYAPGTESLANIARVTVAKPQEITREGQRTRAIGGGHRNPIARLFTNPPTKSRSKRSTDSTAGLAPQEDQQKHTVESQPPAFNDRYGVIDTIGSTRSLLGDHTLNKIATIGYGGLGGFYVAHKILTDVESRYSDYRRILEKVNLRKTLHLAGSTTGAAGGLGTLGFISWEMFSTFSNEDSTALSKICAAAGLGASVADVSAMMANISPIKALNIISKLVTPLAILSDTAGWADSIVQNDEPGIVMNGMALAATALSPIFPPALIFYAPRIWHAVESIFWDSIPNGEGIKQIWEDSLAKAVEAAYTLTPDHMIGILVHKSYETALYREILNEQSEMEFRDARERGAVHEAEEIRAQVHRVSAILSDPSLPAKTLNNTLRRSREKAKEDFPEFVDKMLKSCHEWVDGLSIPPSKRIGIEIAVREATGKTLTWSETDTAYKNHLKAHFTRQARMSKSAAPAAVRAAMEALNDPYGLLIKLSKELSPLEDDLNRTAYRNTTTTTYAKDRIVKLRKRVADLKEQKEKVEAIIDKCSYPIWLGEGAGPEIQVPGSTTDVYTFRKDCYVRYDTANGKVVYGPVGFVVGLDIDSVSHDDNSPACIRIAGPGGRADRYNILTGEADWVSVVSLD